MDTKAFPKTLVDAVNYFSDRDVSLEFFKNLRWPNGVTCPVCGCQKVSFLSTRRLWKCLSCKKQFSAKVGTIFEDSSIDLGKWLITLWILGNSKNGVSSYEIERTIGVSQQTAWYMLHRIREAMKTGTFEKLSGTVEADETSIGQKSRTMHADKRREMRERGFPKTIVFGLRERGGDVRTMVVPNTTADTLQSQIVKHVEAGSKVYTDSWKGYNGMSASYEHGIVDHKAGQYVDGDVTTNGMEGYWNLLKRGYHGTYVQFSPQHTHRYLAEEDFRYNTRKQTDGERFVLLASQVIGKRLTYADLTEAHLQSLAPR